MYIQLRSAPRFVQTFLLSDTCPTSSLTDLRRRFFLVGVGALPTPLLLHCLVAFLNSSRGITFCATLRALKLLINHLAHVAV